MRSKPAIAVLGLYLLACVAIAYAGWAGAVKPVESWDEARRGINAQQMRQFQDYGNYRYLGEYDDFNTKPPLFTWGVAASFELFGVGRSSLRLVSLLAYAAFLLLILRFLLRHDSVSIAAYCLLILIGVNGVLGDHVALGGDTDMLFVLFATLGVLSYYRWIFEGHGPAGYATAMWAGLAFAIITPSDTLYLDCAVPQRCVFALQRANPDKLLLSTTSVDADMLSGRQLAGCPEWAVYAAGELEQAADTSEKPGH